ncbi:hypothetical protein V8E54_004693 [Elaphomyces granulatus]
MPHPLWRPDNQIIIVFLILTFYLIFFAGFADIGKAEGLSGTPYWASCQLSDISKLRDLVDVANAYPDLANLETPPLLWSQRLRRKSKFGNPPSSKYKSDLAGQELVRRSKKQRDLCKERDGVLTKVMPVEIAHISPFSMLNKPEKGSRSKRADFWDLLKIFWTTERITSWKNQIFLDLNNPDVGIEASFNLISFTAHEHAMWNEGLFATKPLTLSDDKKQLTLQFFWQPQYDHRREMDLLTKPVSSKGLKDTTKDGKKCALFYARNDGSPQAVAIESGDIFKLTTENPESHWFMQRLVAMSGAAGWPRFEHDNNDIDPSAVLADGINDCNEDVYNWIPVPESWSGAGIFREIQWLDQETLFPTQIDTSLRGGPYSVMCVGECHAAVAVPISERRSDSLAAIHHT